MCQPLLPFSLAVWSAMVGLVWGPLLTGPEIGEWRGQGIQWTEVIGFCLLGER